MNKQYFFSLIATLLVTCSLCAAASFNVKQTPLYNILEQINTGQAQHQATVLMQSIMQKLIQKVGSDQKIQEHFFGICNSFGSDDGKPVDLADIQPHDLRAFGKKITECNDYMSKNLNSSTVHLYNDIAQFNQAALSSVQETVSRQFDFVDHAIDCFVYRPMEFVSENKVLTVCCATALIAGIAYYYFYPTGTNGSTNQSVDVRNIRGITLVRGDITQQVFNEQDRAAIVNAANSAMRGGAGIDAAVHRAAGPGLLQEERARNLNCPVGEARLTDGHDLAPLRIIHTVGPDTRVPAQNAQRADLLNNAYQNVFNLAVDREIRYVALPSISTGIYGYPIQEAVGIAIDAAIRQQANHPLAEIRFVTFGQRDFDAYTQALASRGLQP